MNFLSKMLTQFAERKPGCWQLVDEIRNERPKLQQYWPEYCFLPAELVERFTGITTTLSLPSHNVKEADLGRLCALAAWRVTQGIYRFDDALFAELWDTPVSDVPTEIFRRLPEWCIYIDVPRPPNRGIFVYMDHDASEKKDQLVIGFDKIDGTVADLWLLTLDLDKRSVLEGVQSQLEEVRKATTEGKIRLPATIEADVMALGNMLSLVLYLCSVNADYERAERPIAKHTKRGFRLFPPAAPKVIDVGIRVGAALKRGIQSLSSDHGDDPSSVSVRPHVRRAHWHHYWIGPKNDAELILKWLSPILVNVDKGEIETTVHPVES